METKDAIASTSRGLASRPPTHKSTVLDLLSPPRRKFPRLQSSSPTHPFEANQPCRRSAPVSCSATESSRSVTTIFVSTSDQNKHWSNDRSVLQVACGVSSSIKSGSSTEKRHAIGESKLGNNHGAANCTYTLKRR